MLGRRGQPCRCTAAWPSPLVGQQGGGLLGPCGRLNGRCQGQVLPGGPRRACKAWSDLGRVPLRSRKRTSPMWLLRCPGSWGPRLGELDPVALVGDENSSTSLVSQPPHHSASPGPLARVPSQDRCQSCLLSDIHEIQIKIS